jgi:hypothetical protein
MKINADNPGVRVSRVSNSEDWPITNGLNPIIDTSLDIVRPEHLFCTFFLAKPFICIWLILSLVLQLNRIDPILFAPFP